MTVRPLRVLIAVAPRVHPEEALVAVRPLRVLIAVAPRVHTEEAVVVSLQCLRVHMALSSSPPGPSGVAAEAQVVAVFCPHARCMQDRVLYRTEAQVVAVFCPYARCIQDRVLFSTARLSWGLAQGLGPIAYRAGVPFRTVGSSGCVKYGCLHASRILLFGTHPLFSTRVVAAEECRWTVRPSKLLQAKDRLVRNPGFVAFFGTCLMTDVAPPPTLNTACNMGIARSLDHERLLPSRGTDFRRKLLPMRAATFRGSTAALMLEMSNTRGARSRCLVHS